MFLFETRITPLKQILTNAFPGFSSQKVRREDAKKSRQDAEQKRRDQLKVSYDKLRTVVPGATEKTSKVLLVNHAMQHIMKLSQENIELRSNVGDLEQDNMDLRKYVLRISHLTDVNFRTIFISLVGELRRKLLDAGVQVEEGDVVMTGISRAPERPVDKPTAPAVSVSVASSSRSSKSKTGENPSVRRKTHSRMGSNASNAAFVVPTSATASSYPAPLSASLHPSSLTNPPLYPPASPAKGTNVPPTLVVNTREPTSSSSYSAPYSASYPAPSPATSASSHSSNSAQRQSVYSPDVPHLNHLFYPSGSSATSSGVSLNVAHLNMDESSYMQQQQDSSGSERGKNSRTLQSSGPYSETNPYSSDSGSSGLQLRPATLSIPPNQTFHNPGLGLDMNQGGLEEGGSMVGYDMSSDTMGMSMGMMSSGGFMDFPGTDGSGMMYPHQDSSTGPYLDPSLSIDGSLHSTSYQDGHDLPPLPGNYNPPRLAFHHSPMNDRFAESDAFLPHSPSSPHSPHFNAGQQQMQYSTSSHQPRAPSHLHISTNAPSLTTGHNLSPQMLHVPPGLASPSNGSPLVAGTPHPQSDAGGSYSEPSRQQGDEAAYIMPGMMMGETSDEGYGEPQNSSGPDSSEGEPPRSWLPMAVPRVITNYFRSG